MRSFPHFAILATLLIFGLEFTLSDQNVYLLYTGPNNALYESLGTYQENGEGYAQVANTYLAYGPTAVYLWGAYFIVFHPGNNGGTLWANLYGYEYGPWVGDTQISIPNRNQAGVGAAFLGDTLYVIYQEVGGNLWYLTTTNAVDFSAATQIPGAGGSETPFAIEFNSKLYVFYQGAGYDGGINYISFDGTSWSGQSTVPNTGTSESPSGVVVTVRGVQQIYLFHQGSGANGQLWLNVFDGSTWHGDQQQTYITEPIASNSGPAVTFANNVINLFYVGRNGWVYWAVLAANGTTAVTQLDIVGATGQPSAIPY